MFLSQRHRVFYQLVALLMLLAFMPASVEAWNLIPPGGKIPVPSPALHPPVKRPPRVPAESQGGLSDPSRDASGTGANTGTLGTDPGAPSALPAPRPLTMEELLKAAGVPTLDANTRSQLSVKLALPAVAGVKEKLTGPQQPIQDSAKKAADALPSAPKELTREALIATQGGESAQDLLDRAHQLLANGQDVESALAYFDVLNKFSRTWAAVDADNGLKVLIGRVTNGEVTPAALANFAERLPSFEQLESVEARYSVVHFLHQESLMAKAQGDANGEADFHRMCRDAAWETLQTNQDHPLQIDVADIYYESADLLGHEEAMAAGKKLEDLIHTVKPCFATWGARHALARHMHKYENDPGKGYLNSVDLLGEAGLGFVDAAIRDEGVYRWIKAWMLYYIGDAHYETGKLDEAMGYYDRIIQEYPDSDQVLHMAAYAKAFVTDRQHPEQPALGIEAFSEYVSTYPDGMYADMAWFGIAFVYYRCREYASAAELMGDIIKKYPGSRGGKAAEQLMGYMERWELLKAPEETAPKLQMCGPVALQRLLAVKGVQTTVDELAALAGTTESGTSMYGLMQAAQRKGVLLTGVEASDVTQLEPPFIAFLDGNHFVTVLTVAAGAVIFGDLDKPVNACTREAFAARWDGKALVCAKADALAALPDYVTMATQGGCDGFPAGTPWCHPSHSAPLPSSYVTGYAPNPAADANGMAIHVYQTSQWLHENDLSLPVTGGNAIQFGRTFYNRWGMKRTDIDGSYPWMNTIGVDWNHNYNFRVYASSTESSGVPVEAVLYDDSGDADYYANPVSDGAGNHVYSVTSSESTDKLGIQLLRNDTSHCFTMKVPSGRQYGFSTITDDAYRVARLEWIKDRDGNQISLEYNGVNGSGRLTKVTPPGTDDRYLYLSYLSTLITKAELKKDDDVLATVEYEYANSDLTKVTRVDNSEMHFTYGTVGGVYGSHYMASRTDPNNHQTTFTSAYAYDSTNQLSHCTKVTMTTPDGVVTGYERDATPNLYSTQDIVTKSYSATTLQKTGYYSGNQTGYLSNSTELWEDPGNAASTKTYAYSYDNDRDLNAVTKPGAATASQTYTYTDNGRVSTVKDAENKGATYVYAANGLDVSQVTDAANLETDLTYDGTHVSTVTHPSIGVNGYTFAYDPGSGQIESVTNPASGTVTYAYDATGNMTSTTDPNGLTSYTYYDDLGRVTRRTNARGKSSYMEYDGGCGGCGGGGHLTKTIDADGRETVFDYDEAGNRVKVTDNGGLETDYIYDSMNRLTQITSPSGSSNHMYYAYDLLGRQTKTTDFNGTVRNFKYDGLGRLVTKSVGTSPEDITERITYYDSGKPYSISDGNGNDVATYFYDSLDRVTMEVDWLYKIKMYYYDAAGRLTKKGGTINGTFDPTEYCYDNDTGRMTKIRYTSGGTTDEATLQYDAVGRQTKVEDWMGGNGLRYGYDPGGRLTQITDYNDDTLSYAYDDAGNVTTMTDWHGRTSSYTYTDGNLVDTITAPGSKTWEYGYTAVGQPYSRVNPNETVTMWLYDARNRMTSTYQWRDFFQTCDSLTYDLDAQGNITRTTNFDNTVWDYGYDGRYRLTSAVRKNQASSPTVEGTYTYAYDAADNMVSKIEPFKDDFNDGDATGWTTQGTWDVSNHAMSKAGTDWGDFYRSNTDADNDLWFAYRNDDDTVSGRILDVYPRRYDSDNRVLVRFEVTQMLLMIDNGGTWTTVDTDGGDSTQGTWYEVYVRCDGGNVTVYRREKDSSDEFAEVMSATSVPVTTTTYLDFVVPENQLTSVDAIRCASNSLSSNTALCYNMANELTKATSGGIDTKYYYDEYGRQISKNYQNGAHTASYTYRYDSKLCTVATDMPDEKDVELDYGADGKPRFVTDDNGTMQVRFDKGWNLINFDDDQGNGIGWLPYHPQQDAMPPLGFAMGTEEGQYDMYFFQDNIGSTRRIRGDDKAAAGSFEFSPYGERYLAGGPTLFDFAGKLLFDQAGLLYFPYRMYDPTQARWMMRDPAGFVDGPNSYVYARQSPVKFADLKGDKSWGTLNFVLHYFFGGGAPVNLADPDVGLLGAWRSLDTTQQVLTDYKSRVAIQEQQAAQQYCDEGAPATPFAAWNIDRRPYKGAGYAPRYPWHPLYVLGTHDLHAASVCVFKTKCAKRTAEFSCLIGMNLDEPFEDPLSIFHLPGIGQRLRDAGFIADFGYPYQIQASFQESYGGSCSW